MSNCSEPIRLVPGPTGSPGADGTNGTNGVDAFTTLSAQFTMPVVGNTAVATVGNSSWCVIGEPVYLQSAGTLIVTATTDSTHVTLQNPAGYSGNVVAGTIIAVASKLGPSGFIGPSGSGGSAGSGVTVAAKGDLQTSDGVTPSNLAVGANGTRPVADSVQAVGIRYDKVDLSLAAEVKNQLPVANGGTGSGTAAGAATNLAVLPLSGGTLTGDLVISKAAAELRLINSAGAANEKRWELSAGAARLELTSVDDAGGVFNLGFSISRTGSTPTRLDAYYDLHIAGAAKIDTFADFQQQINSALAAGDNNNVALGSKTYIKLQAGPIGAFAITGISGGVDGRMIKGHNDTGQTLTLKHENVLSTASNRIHSSTGADVTCNMFELIYDTDAQRWQIVATA